MSSNADDDQPRCATAGKKPPETTRQAQERKLDGALKDTFPASDPLPQGHVTGDEDVPEVDRQTPRLDRELVERLARELREEQAKSKA